MTKNGENFKRKLICTDSIIWDYYNDFNEHLGTKKQYVSSSH